MKTRISCLSNSRLKQEYTRRLRRSIVEQSCSGESSSDATESDSSYNPSSLGDDADVGKSIDYDDELEGDIGFPNVSTNKEPNDINKLVNENLTDIVKSGG